MSSAMKKTSTITKKPFCKVCFDAGKDSAHPLRNAAGQTMCPYLLSLRCNNCHKSGHTVKYCTSSKRLNTPTRAPEPNRAQPKQAQQNKKEEAPKQKTHFDVFQKLIADEEEKEMERENEELAQRLQELAHKTNFPAISEKNVVEKKTSDRILTGWSKAVGKPVKVYETLSEEEEDAPAEKEMPQKKEQKQDPEQKQQEPEQVEQEQEEQEQQEQEQEEQEQEEQEQVEPEQQEQEQEEQEPELNTYRPTYTSWADCE